MLTNFHKRSCETGFPFSTRGAELDWPRNVDRAKTQVYVAKILRFVTHYRSCGDWWNARFANYRAGVWPLPRSIDDPYMPRFLQCVSSLMYRIAVVRTFEKCMLLQQDRSRPTHACPPRRGVSTFKFYRFCILIIPKSDWRTESSVFVAEVSTGFGYTSFRVKRVIYGRLCAPDETMYAR